MERNKLQIMLDNALMHEKNGEYLSKVSKFPFAILVLAIGVMATSYAINPKNNLTSIREIIDFSIRTIAVVGVPGFIWIWLQIKIYECGKANREQMDALNDLIQTKYLNMPWLTSAGGEGYATEITKDLGQLILEFENGTKAPYHLTTIKRLNDDEDIDDQSFNNANLDR